MHQWNSARKIYSYWGGDNVGWLEVGADWPLTSPGVELVCVAGVIFNEWRSATSAKQQRVSPETMQKRCVKYYTTKELEFSDRSREMTKLTMAT